MDRRLLLPSAVALLLLGACGDDEPFADLSAEEVLAAGQEAADQAGSVYVVGDAAVQGQDTALDLRLGDGRATGSVTVEGAELEVRVDDETVVFAGSSAFWERSGASAAAAEQLDGRFVDASGQPGVEEGFGALLDRQGLLEAFFGELEGGDFTKAGVTEVDGVEAFALEDASGGRLLVSTGEQPYPLRLEDEEVGTVDFREWDEPVEVDVPADAVPIDQLQSELQEQPQG